MGRARRHKDNAAKQKAYRERVKAREQGLTQGQTALIQRVMASQEKHRDILDKLAE